MSISISRAELRQVLAATYHQVWRPPTSDVRHDDAHLPVWHEASARYLDPATGEFLPTWDEALDAIGDTDQPLHVARFGPKFDAQGVLAGSRDSARCIGAGAWTVILIVSAAGALVAGATTLRIKPRRPMLLATVVVVPHAAPIILLALQLPWQTFAAAALVTGFGEMLFNTLWETTLQQRIPPASLSRVSAYDWFGSLLCEPLGLALAGVAAAAIGMSTTLWIAAAVDLAAVAAMLAAPSVWRLRRVDESQLIKQSAQSLAAD